MRLKNPKVQKNKRKARISLVTRDLVVKAKATAAKDVSSTTHLCEDFFVDVGGGGYAGCQGEVEIKDADAAASQVSVNIEKTGPSSQVCHCSQVC